LFLIFAQYKIFGNEFIYHGGFEGWIHRFLRDGAYPFMAPFLRDLILPHARLFAHVVAYGELCIGLGLVLGVLVRPASFFGFLYMIVLLFSSNYPGRHAAIWEYFGASLNHLVLALCFVAFGMSHAARVWSLPAYLQWKYGGGNRNDAIELDSSGSNVFNK
jgi:uncharacterized membrane protein YphA (DoxX/SURF4 family)